MSRPTIDRHIGLADLEVIPGEARSFRVESPTDELTSYGTWTAHGGDGYSITGTVTIDGTDLVVTFAAGDTLAMIGRPWRVRLNGADAFGGQTTQALPQSDPFDALTVEVDTGSAIVTVIVVAVGGAGGPVDAANVTVDSSGWSTSWVADAWGTPIPTDVATMLEAIDLAGTSTLEAANRGAEAADTIGGPGWIDPPATAPADDRMVTTVGLTDDIALTSVHAGTPSAVPWRVYVVREDETGGHAFSWPVEVAEVGDCSHDPAPGAVSVFVLAYSPIDNAWTVRRFSPIAEAAPAPHADTHGAAGSDPVEIETSQVIDLDAALDFRVTDDDPRLVPQVDETLPVGAGTLPVTEARVLASLTNQETANAALDRMVGNAFGDLDSLKLGRDVLTTETFAYPDGVMAPGFVTDARNGGDRLPMVPYLEGEVRFSSGRLTRVIPPPAGSTSTSPPTLLVDNVGTTNVRVEATFDGITGNTGHFGFVVVLHSNTPGSQASVTARVAPNGMVQILSYDAAGTATQLASTAAGVFTNGARVYIEVKDGRVKVGLGTTQHLDIATPVVTGSGNRAGIRLQGSTAQIYVDNVWIGSPYPAPTPALHAASHGNAGADRTTLDASQITTGVFPIARLATGTPTGSKFVRDDGTLAVPAGSGSGLAEVRVGAAAFMTDSPGTDAFPRRIGTSPSRSRVGGLYPDAVDLTAWSSGPFLPFASVDMYLDFLNLTNATGDVRWRLCFGGQTDAHVAMTNYDATASVTVASTGDDATYGRLWSVQMATGITVPAGLLSLSVTRLGTHVADTLLGSVHFVQVRFRATGT